VSDQLAILILVFVGAQLALQAPINNGLGRHTGPLTAAAVSFIVGSLALGVVAILAGHFTQLARITEASPYMLIGGVLGAIFVLTATIVIRTIGAGAVAAGTITGMLVSSVAIDSAGVLGLDKEPVTLLRLLGCAALIGGTILIVLRKSPDEDETEAGEARTGISWKPILAVLGMGFASCAVAIQAPVNAQLAEHTGEVNSAFISFTVGSIVLVLAVVLSGQARSFGAIREAHRWQLTGGFMGAINSTAALVFVQAVGAGVVTAATIAGQMAASVVIDRFGAFGLEKTAFSAARIAGIVLLAAGVLLVAG